MYIKLGNYFSKHIYIGLVCEKEEWSSIKLYIIGCKATYLNGFNAIIVNFSNEKRWIMKAKKDWWHKRASITYVLNHNWNHYGFKIELLRATISNPWNTKDGTQHRCTWIYVEVHFAWLLASQLLFWIEGKIGMTKQRWN